MGVCQDVTKLCARPRAVMCYICGREFGSSSIGIHEKQCAKKWEETEAQKPLRERKPLPQRPDVADGATLEERNQAVKEVYEEQSMVHCQGCGRRFKDEATLQRHQRGCAACKQDTSNSSGRQLPPEMQAAADAKEREFKAMIAAEGGAKGGDGVCRPVKPRTVMCYICGREFGRSSIDIHEKQCAKKWADAEAQKPPGERKPLPQRPAVADGATLEERNQAVKEVYEEQSMAHCQGCGRRFKDEATLQKHQQGCAACKGNASGSSGRQLPPEMQAAAEAKEKELKAMIAAEGCAKGGGGCRPVKPRTAMCYICGREFGRSSIEIHEKQCAKKWEDTEAQKPLRERKPLPQRPEVVDGATLEERNQAMKDAYEEQSMAHCPGCGRRFKDEATLRRHQRGCAACKDGSSNSTGRQLPPEMQAAADVKEKELEAMMATPSVPSSSRTSRSSSKNSMSAVGRLVMHS